MRESSLAAVLLSLALLAGLTSQGDLRADSVSSFAWLRSAYFDRDLDFANEWAHWGLLEPPRTETGLRRNVHSVGPALLWSPFYAAATRGSAKSLRAWATGGYPIYCSPRTTSWARPLRSPASAAATSSRSR